MKIQVFNNNLMGTALVAEGIPGYIPFGFPPEVVLAQAEGVKAHIHSFDTSDDPIYAPVGNAVAELEV